MILGVISVLLKKTIWFKCLSAVILSALKFVPGVLLCISLGLSTWEQILVTIGGGILGIFFFTYFGIQLREWIHRKIFRRKQTLTKVGTTSKNWKIRIWNKYGLMGAAFLTPPILSPPVGVALALSFGTPKDKLLLYMTSSIIFWSFAFAFLKQPIFTFLTWIGILP
ncbi:MAG: hypothetical protein RML72_03455 [Bacteroidia bacterium]|nr:hypothetical protein [Bacteroidia bacterium]MDW8157919.1 hypothetical protein [Bacteroidia bacterium]